ncbi:hypothetical protein L1D55_00535 [Vibrio sp. Isolate22]|uniref:hypothetical protein n=1 Tax=Vibrio sp. Isolate22 TaxID=2908532 RepID=UPI001EFE4B48|nr:hypothetical protein [Vibrio sp. Isolate22]MCG9690297.1 hypothetical protein [Vibrio sp. Isolate22]
MARITKAQREKNFQSYNALILEIFLNEGWEHVTYDRLSKETGLRKSTLQGYYPSNANFDVAIKGKVFPILIQRLDFSNKETLLASWQRSLQHHQFRMIMRMFIMQAYKKGGESSSRVVGLGQILEQKLPNEDALHLIRVLFGLTVTDLLGISKL